MRINPIIAILALSTMTACAPSPSEVCDHMAELVTKDTPDAPKLDTSECVSSVQRKQDMKGLFKYRSWAKCVVKASSFEAADACK